MLYALLIYENRPTSRVAIPPSRRARTSAHGASITGQWSRPESYVMLEMTPKGRNETERGNPTEWVRPHDRYDTDGHVDQIGQFVATKGCCQSA